MTKTHVVVIGIDGLRPDMIEEATMPNLTALRRKGVASSEHRTIFPSETHGALSSLATGTRPRSTGMLGNEFYSRDGSGRPTTTQSIHHWRSADRRIVGGLITTPSLAEVMAKHERKLGVVTSSGHGCLTTLNWNGAQWGQYGFNSRHPAISFPHDLAANIMDRQNISPLGVSYDDGSERRAVRVFTEGIWPAARPDIGIIWLTEVDGASHRYGLGAPDMVLAMKRCDDAIGDLVAWRDAQPEDIALFVTSDHGHSTVVRSVSIREALGAAGIKADYHLDDGADILYRGGRAPGLWLRQWDKGLLQAAFDVFLAQDWYGACFTRAREAGSHEGLIEGTLALELTGADHARAPDLYINLPGDDAANDYGVIGSSSCDTGAYTTLTGGSTHGGFHPNELKATLIGHGPGLLAGGQALASRTGIFDLAPTMLEMIGLVPPVSMTGRVLHELLDNGVKVPAPEGRTYVTSHAGKTSQLNVSLVGEAVYLDEAKLA